VDAVGKVCGRDLLPCHKPTTLPTCLDFGGTDTEIPGTRCCPADCGAYCGAYNCARRTGCCAVDAVGKVCGRDSLPCHKPISDTCSYFGGIDTQTPGTRCCPASCGDKCGAGNCNEGTDCCGVDAVGKVCGIDPLPCHKPTSDTIPTFPPTSPPGNCGRGDRGNGRCPDQSLCCSRWGYCGTAAYGYCDP